MERGVVITDALTSLQKQHPPFRSFPLPPSLDSLRTWQVVPSLHRPIRLCNT